MDSAVDENGRGEQEEDVHGVEASLPVVGLLHGGGRDDDAMGDVQFILLFLIDKFGNSLFMIYISYQRTVNG